jgi:DNA-binding XRE family transcriptional regulator
MSNAHLPAQVFHNSFHNFVGSAARRAVCIRSCGLRVTVCRCYCSAWRNKLVDGLDGTMKNMKKLRAMTGRGQCWLAGQTGIERSRLSLIENGRVDATEHEKAAIEKALTAAMRENIAQFSRLSGVAIQSL